MKNRQKKYRGKLSLEQIAEGIAICLQNARALVEDAIILRKAKRHPRALTCLLAADQELGKIHVLLSMARIHPSKQIHWADKWKSFRSHEIKAAHAIMDTFPNHMRTSPENILPMALDSYVKAPTDEEIRQACLYVDYSPEEGGWLSPLKITRDTVDKRFNSTVATLERLQRLADMGLFCVKALRIQHEELSEIASDLPPYKDLTPEHVRSVLPRLTLHLKRCYKRIMREALLSEPPDNFEIMGQRWREFIEN